jgi:hypothetical protein
VRSLHPGNAWSSVVYTVLGLYLLASTADMRPWCRRSEGATLLWFSWLSFHFHATESAWTNALDITMVTHLCMSCLTHCLGLPDLACVGLTWTATGGLLANAWSHRYDPSAAACVQHMVPLLAPLVAALLALQAQAGAWGRFAAFGGGFAVKLADRRLAAGGVRAGVVNGTSMFHLLTGAAMYLHYAEVLLTPLGSSAQ